MAVSGPFSATRPSVLLISDVYDSPNLNRQVAQILVAAGAKVYCTVLDAAREEHDKAQRDGVQLIPPVQHSGDPRPPSLEWLTYDHRPRYPNLPEDVNYIVGHADITDTAARNIKDERFPQADLIMFTHVLPEDTEYYKRGRKAMKAWEKGQDMLYILDNAKAAFSVGQRIYDHFSNMYRGGKKPQSHHIFLPKPPELFLSATVRPGGEQKVVLSIGRVMRVEKLKGHDLAAQSMREVVKIIKNVRLRVRGISEDDFEMSKKILEDALNSPDLNPTLLPYGTQEEIRNDMMKAHLVLMPSRSEPFGLVGLEAIAAGIPVLISDKTGLADMIKDLIRQKKLSAEHRNVIVETSVNVSDRAGDAKRWAERIVDVLKHSDSEFEKAARFKQELMESRYWEESHNAFLQACGITAAEEIDDLAAPLLRTQNKAESSAGYHDVPIEVQLRGPEMARLYAEASRQESLPVHSTRVPVVGQFRSGKTCFIKRLMGETVSRDEKEKEPITDGIHIISDVQSKTWKKSPEEIDDLAAPLLRTERNAEPSAEEENKDVDMTEPSQQETETEPSQQETETEPSQQETETEPSQQETEEAPEDTVEDDNKQDTSPAQQETNVLPIQKSKGQKSKPDLPSKQQASETPTIPEHLREAAERMLKAGITKEELGTADHPRLSFWDFGGQATYYGTHHCFITYRGVYILVMSLKQKLSDLVSEQDSRASVDNLRTGGDYLDHWLNTVRSHTLQHETREPEGKQSSSQDKTSRGTGRPPVVIVLTHKDKVPQEYIEKYKEEIRSHIKGKAAGGLVMPEIFAVDNTTEDAAVDKIRDYIRQVAKGLPHMGEEIPIPWLHLKSRLRKKREEGPFCKFQEVAKLARDPDINITDEHTLALVLTFLHDRGDIIFFDEPSLRDDVTLQPQVLIDVFKTIITVPEYRHGIETDPKMWERLEQKGVLSDTLLTRIWEKKDRQLEKPFLMYPEMIKMFETWLEQEGVLSDKLLTRIWEKKKQQLDKPFLLEHKSFLKALMEKFYLICNATPVGDVNASEEIYFVPALLSCERDNAMLYPDNMHMCPQALYFVFIEQFLPSGMFSRLQALCVRRFGLQKSCVFAGCARFPTDDEEQAFVISKVNHYLKVELLSSSNVFTEGLSVRKFLSSALFEIKEKWIPCIQYELCCSTQEDKGGEPAFRPLPTEYRPLEQLWGIPSVFREVWMPGVLQCNRTANSEGEGPVILHPIEDPDTIVGMRTIGPVLDIMELGGGLTLGQCDHIRNQLTPIQRVLDMRRQGEVDPHLLGAAVEMCSPEFVDLFSREKRGKELVILHAKDDTDEFVEHLQTVASESGLPCHTEVITSTDSITEKTVELLLNTKNRMVALVISPQTLHHKHWSNLAYEFSVRNKKLLLPILMYKQGFEDRIVSDLHQRSPVLFNMKHEETQMGGSPVAGGRLQGIVHNVLFGSIFSPLDEAGVKSLSRVWWAQPGGQKSQGIKTPQDLMRAMAKTGHITAGDFEKLEKDMIAAGISFPVIVRDNPGVSDKFQNQRTETASVGPVGREVEIPGLIKLAVPSDALQRDTTLTVSTVDIPRILMGPKGASWTSGYPWSLGKDVCPREVLDQVLFSPAVHVNLHGAQLNRPVELKTWRPPGAEGMECILLKHHDGEGWIDITASTLHHIDSNNLSVHLSTFSKVAFVWTVAKYVKSVTAAVLGALLSKTLNCRFAAYCKPGEKEKVDFHVVMWDQSVNPNEEIYAPGFIKCCVSQAAMLDLYHGDKLEVAASVDGGQKESNEIVLHHVHCCSKDRQNTQMRLKRPNSEPVTGKVAICKLNSQQPEPVCDFFFEEKESRQPLRERAMKRSVAPDLDDIDSGVSEAESVDVEALESRMVPGDSNRTDHGAGSHRTKEYSGARAHGSDSDLSTPTEQSRRKKSKKGQQSDGKPGSSGIKKGSWTKGDVSRMKSSPQKKPSHSASPPLRPVSTKKRKESNDRQTEDGADDTESDESDSEDSDKEGQESSMVSDDTESSESDSDDSDREGQESSMVTGSGRKPVVLMLNDEYGTAKGGISTIHRQMARFLVSKGATIYSTVLKANKKDRKDATDDGVKLIFPHTFKGDDRQPDLKWLTFDHQSRYPDEKLPSDVDFIVGHVNITSRAARRIKKKRRPKAKLVQVTHVIPEDVAPYKSEGKVLSIEEEKNGILKDLKAADVIVSVGPRLYDYYRNETRDANRNKEFLPEPSDIFKNTDVTYLDTERKVVLSIGRVKGVERLKGYDLAGKTMVKVIKELPDTLWRVCGISHEDFKESKEIIEASTEKDKIHFTPLKYKTQKELSREIKQAHVVLMPSRAEPFGLVGLEAIAAGVPVLVSHKSGLAKFLKKQDPEFDRTIVEIEDDDDEAAKTLAKRITKILKDGPREFKAAQSLKKKLLESNYWAESHIKFLEIFGL